LIVSPRIVSPRSKKSSFIKPAQPAPCHLSSRSAAPSGSEQAAARRPADWHFDLLPSPGIRPAFQCRPWEVPGWCTTTTTPGPTPGPTTTHNSISNTYNAPKSRIHTV
jgi:hypothetical protein